MYDHKDIILKFICVLCGVTSSWCL